MSLARKSEIRSTSFDSFPRAKSGDHEPERNRRASISSYPEARARNTSICLSDDSWVQSPQQVAVEWVNDELVSNCRGCDKGFSMIIRKHHCRSCGNVFCGTCTSFRIMLKGYNDRQRVCLHCISSFVGDSGPPPRSPHAPRAPTDVAVNTYLPDDLDELFSDIIEEDPAPQTFKPRRASSSVSRPPRKLFQSGSGTPSKIPFQTTPGIYAVKFITTTP
jgi:hypothetical protein